MCHWLDQVMKVHHNTVAMEWMSIKEERVYRAYVSKGVRQHSVPTLALAKALAKASKPFKISIAFKFLHALQRLHLEYES